LTLEELTAKDKDLLQQVSMLPAISRIETPEKKLLVELYSWQRCIADGTAQAEADQAEVWKHLDYKRGA